MKVRQLLTTYVLPCLLLLLSFTAQAQTTAVTGKVTDSKNGAPLAGASVVVKGTKKGVVTDASGNFSLQVSASAKTLVISSVGYKAQEISLSDGTSGLQVGLLIGSSDLNDVVVIGYGTQKKKDLTGAISSVSAKDFQQGAITSPDQLIAGKVAGVSVTPNGGQPGAGSVIRIRGLASLNGNNDPLIVIDGFPMSGNGVDGVANPLALINPDDIENITVLKDASAAAIYGSRGSSGVILITTKKGAGGKPKFVFNTIFSVSKVAKEEDVMSADQFRNYVKTTAPTLGDAAFVPLLGTANTDWQKQIYQTALTTTDNLSISGALKNLPYRFSVGYLDQQGILKTDDLKRGTASLHLTPRFLDNNLKVDVNMNGSMTQSIFANQGAIGAAITFDPTQPVYDPKSKYGGYWEWRQQPGDTTIISLADRNPVSLINLQRNVGYTARAFGNVNFDYKFHFLPDLHAIVLLNYDGSSGYGSTKSPSYAAAQANNSPGPGYYTQYSSNYIYIDNQAGLDYAKDIRSIKSNLTVSARYEYQNNLQKNKNYANFDSKGDTIAGSSPTYPNSYGENTLISYFGRLIYSYDNKYVLTASIRDDESSRFNAANRSAVFPAVALAWRANQENFLKNVSWLTNLKFRGSYGVTGNQDGLPNYGYINSYYLSLNSSLYQFGNKYYPLSTPSSFYTPLKWEQTASTNVGVDFGLFNNRITGSVDYYNKHTTNLLNSVFIPDLTNFSNELEINIGSMNSNGVELNLNLIPIQSKNFNWSMNVNFAYNKTKIIKLNNNETSSFYGDPTGGISGATGQTIQIQSVGYSPNAFYVLQQMYNSAGKPIEGLYVDQDRDGKITEPNDQYHYKSPFAPVIMGFSTTFDYRKWSLNIVARANIGNYMYNNVASSQAVSRGVFNPQNTLDNAPTSLLKTNFVYNQYQSDYYIENASFVKVDNIGVGYNVGKIAPKLSLKLNAFCQNVCVITKYTGIDPEVYGGIDNNLYPRPRIYTLGASLGF